MLKMEQILKGGTELILGGGVASETLQIGITVIAALLLFALALYMKKNPPSSLFGQIAYIIGCLGILTLTLFTCLRGISIAMR